MFIQWKGGRVRLVMAKDLFLNVSEWDLNLDLFYFVQRQAILLIRLGRADLDSWEPFWVLTSADSIRHWNIKMSHNITKPTKWVCVQRRLGSTWASAFFRVFSVHMKEPWVLSYPMRAQWKLWSDLADAQADWVFAGRKLILSILSYCGSNYFH